LKKTSIAEDSWGDLDGSKEKVRKSSKLRNQKPVNLVDDLEEAIEVLDIGKKDQGQLEEDDILKELAAAEGADYEDDFDDEDEYKMIEKEMNRATAVVSKSSPVSILDRKTTPMGSNLIEP